MVKHPVTGKIALVSNESGVDVLIDEKYSVKTIAGQRVFIDELLPGPRQLRAIKSGFREWRMPVTVISGETVTVRIEMKPVLDPEMVRVPEGTYIQGSDEGTKDQR